MYKDFFSIYTKEFLLLFFLLVIEGTIAAFSVLSIVPLADFILDPTLSNSSRITRIIINGLGTIDLEPSFLIFSFLFIFFNFFKALIDIIIRHAILKIKYIVLRNLFGDTLSVFFKARWGFFSNSSQGELLNTLIKELNNVGDTISQIATLCSQIIQLLIYLIVPLLLNPVLTLTALSLSLLFGAPFLLFYRLSYRLGQENTKTSNKAMNVLSEILGATRLILGFGLQAKASNLYLNAFDEHVKVTLKSQTLSTAVPKFFTPMGMLAVIISMGLFINQELRISELTAVMWSLLATLPSIAAILQGNIGVSNFIPSFEQVMSLRKDAYDFEEIQGERNFIKLNNEILLKDLTFTYPGRHRTLNDINLCIRKGQMTAIIGHSGSGKSTVTDLILGLQVPDKGFVIIDGVPLSDFKQNSFRERVGYVPQDPQLFNSTIRENMLWSFDKASEREIWNALSLANAASFIEDLPDGINTLVGDRGIRLSGGQRQRIALARALLRKPDLLILDEATSSLDSESELLIQQSIEKVAKETTILIVAHRLSTISKADKVYVLSKGTIIEEGTFIELSNKENGILKKMLIAQLLEK